MRVPVIGGIMALTSLAGTLIAGPGVPAKTSPTEDYSDPIKTYRTYLEAVKRDDLVTAKACHSVKKPEDSLLRDIMVELWIAHHRFQKLVSAKFGKQEDCRYWRPDCTDEAIDRTIARLATSNYEIKGETAELKIDWAKDDEEVFEFTGDHPKEFLKVNGTWKMPCDGDGDPDQIAGPGTWGWCFREGAKLLNQVSDGIECGKLTTWEQASGLLDKGTAELEKQYGKDREDRMTKERPAAP